MQSFSPLPMLLPSSSTACWRSHKRSGVLAVVLLARSSIRVRVHSLINSPLGFATCGERRGRARRRWYESILSCKRFR